MPLDLDWFTSINVARCQDADGFGHSLQSWTLSEWITATLGELGEAANIIKKLNRIRDRVRGNKETPSLGIELRRQLAEELADTFIYLNLLTVAAGFVQSEIVAAKFNATSRRIGYPEVVF